MSSAQMAAILPRPQCVKIFTLCTCESALGKHTHGMYWDVLGCIIEAVSCDNACRRPYVAAYGSAASIENRAKRAVKFLSLKLRHV